MANNSTLFILLIVLVIAFIFLSLTPRTSYVPYNGQRRMYSSYESMTPMEATEMPTTTMEATEMPTTTMEATEMPTPESTEYSNNAEEERDSFNPIIDVPRTVHYGPFRDSEIIDKFSQVTTNGMDGVNGCISSGLSNSGGYICLTPELVQLLKTRGGNAAGGECLSKCSSSK